MKIKFKKLTDEISNPTFISGNPGIALVATSKIFDKFGNVKYGTGLSIEIPEGYIGLILPLQKVFKKDVIYAGSIGTIQPGDIDEVFIRFKPSGYFASIPDSLAEGTDTNHFDYICFGKEDEEDEDCTSLYEVGDRVAQLILLPKISIELEEIKEATINESSSVSNEIPYQGTTNYES